MRSRVSVQAKLSFSDASVGVIIIVIKTHKKKPTIPGRDIPYIPLTCNYRCAANAPRFASGIDGSLRIDSLNSSGQ